MADASLLISPRWSGLLFSSQPDDGLLKHAEPGQLTVMQLWPRPVCFGPEAHTVSLSISLFTTTCSLSSVYDTSVASGYSPDGSDVSMYMYLRIYYGYIHA